VILTITRILGINGGGGFGAQENHGAFRKILLIPFPWSALHVGVSPVPAARNERLHFEA
jgi:hypothetical protein